VGCAVVNVVANAIAVVAADVVGLTAADVDDDVDEDVCETDCVASTFTVAVNIIDRVALLGLLGPCLIWWIFRAKRGTIFARPAKSLGDRARLATYDHFVQARAVLSSDVFRCRCLRNAPMILPRYSSGSPRSPFPLVYFQHGISSVVLFCC